MLTQAELSIFEFARGVGACDVPSAAQIEKVITDLAPLQGSALLIGGMAVIHYGYRRSTDDVDLLYANADHDILKRLKPKFKTVTKAKSGWHKLEHKETKVRLELIPEGGLTNYGFIPGPRTVGAAGSFITFEGLLWLKLVSGRIQDRADVAILMKTRLTMASTIKKSLPPELHEQFDELVAQAKFEVKTDPYKKKK